MTESGKPRGWGASDLAYKSELKPFPGSIIRDPRAPHAEPTGSVSFYSTRNSNITNRLKSIALRNSFTS